MRTGFILRIITRVEIVTALLLWAFGLLHWAVTFIVCAPLLVVLVEADERG